VWRNVLRDGRGMLLDRVSNSEAKSVDAGIMARALLRARKGSAS
jgi:hypothetical protein